MRIKRFIAPDMRAALRMVRDEHGPDAVILSNRPTAHGIEVVAATDYDESLVHQALRAIAPGLNAAPGPNAVPGLDVATTTTSVTPPPLPQHHAIAAPTAMASAHANTAASMSHEAAHAGNAATHEPRAGIADGAMADSAATPLRAAARAPARAVFAIGDGTVTAIAEPVAPPATHLDRMLAALRPNRQATGAAKPVAAAAAPIADAMQASLPATPTPATPATPIAAHAQSSAPAPAATPSPSFAAALAAAWTTADDDATSPDTTAATGTDSHATHGARGTAVIDRGTHSPADTAVDVSEDSRVPPSTRTVTDVVDESVSTSTPATTAPATATPATPLRAVADAVEHDPAMAAMRSELAAMRALIERQMDQFAVERLRGSPARALAHDALLGYGCDDALAHAVAAKLDPRLDPTRAHPAMLAELARMLHVARAEPIDDGGVIALVGPTGAGKTTTIARLAARFAARHRSRDVALLTTDCERPGAREQLHALGRRLGITVCEAAGTQGLDDALAQLADYPLVLVDTAGHGLRARALFAQIAWLRASRAVRSLLVLPANANPHDLDATLRRYRLAAPEAVVLTKIDETGRLGAALSVLVRHELPLAYTGHGQDVTAGLDAADAARLVLQLEKSRRAADNPLATEDCHVVA